MIWYFKDEIAYNYPSEQEVSNDLTKRFHKSVYEDSNEMELYYSLNYMKEHSIPALSVVFPLEDLSVNYGTANDINKEFCDNNNIHYRYEERSGGCMVLFPGNIIIQDVYPTNNFLRQHAFTNDFVNWLIEKGINATTDNNDVMVDNKKIIGTVSYTLQEPYRGWVYFLASISINVDSDLISNICTKNSTKIPGALSTYGITTDEVMEWTLNWFNEHQYTEQ